jgi:hypothetical protein
MLNVEAKSFETFLEGDAYKSNLIDSVVGGRNTADRYYRSNEIGGYLQDKWQLLSNLSITIGGRYDYHGGLTEKYGNMFNFDPALYGTSAQVPAFLVANQVWLIFNGLEQKSLEIAVRQLVLVVSEGVFRPRETLRPLRGQPVAVLV